jgi:hypothetical protein
VTSYNNPTFTLKASLILPPSTSNYSVSLSDELDDFEVKLPVTKTLFDILCELLADTKDTSLTQEPVIKSALLLFGNYIEETILNQTSYYLHYYCTNAKIPSETKIETLSLELEEFVGVVLSGVPGDS